MNRAMWRKLSLFNWRWSQPEAQSSQPVTVPRTQEQMNEREFARYDPRMQEYVRNIPSPLGQGLTKEEEWSELNSILDHAKKGWGRQPTREERNRIGDLYDPLEHAR